MKTKLVRPVLVKDNTELNIGDLCISPRYKGKLLKFGSFENSYSQVCVKQQIVLTSLDSEENIEVGDTFLYQFGPFKSDWEIISCTKENIEGIKDNCKKVIAQQCQLSPKLIEKLFEEYNSTGLKDFEIGMEECFNHICDKYENILYPSDYVNCQGNLVKLFKKNGELAFNVYGKDEYVREYFRNDITRCDSKGYFLPSEKAILIYKPKLTNGFITNIAFIDDKIIYWAKQLEHKSLSLHELVENAKWLINKVAYTESETREIARQASILYLPSDIDEESYNEDFNVWFQKNKK